MKNKTVLVIDDDRDTRILLCRILEKGGYAAESAENAITAMKILENSRVSVILLDLLMPGMSGMEFCTALQSDNRLSRIPVIMITSRDDSETRREALNAGVADFLPKSSIDRKTLSEMVDRVVKRAANWGKLDLPVSTARLQDFSAFTVFLSKRLGRENPAAVLLASASPGDYFEKCSEAGLDPMEAARAIAAYLHLPLFQYIDPETIAADMLPAAFSRAHHVLAVNDGEVVRFVMSNPFAPQLIDMLESLSGEPPSLGVASPESIDALLRKGEETAEAFPEIETPDDDPKLTEEVTEFTGSIEIAEKPSDEDVRRFPIRYIADSILFSAVSEGASDIHIEPKPDKVMVRFRVDGDMKDMFTLKKRTGSILISRFKVLGEMDIAERRKPQDGIAEAMISGRAFKMRFATTSTPQGESLIVRILDLYAKPKKLTELGMTDAQSESLYEISGQNSGAIVVCGPTGSGKTTTLYSLISHIDIKNRSLMTIEDPVEYRIPYANQQQVNEKAGVTFEALLRSAVRQDPDIVYLGEIRDGFSARTCLDLASTGHMTLTTLHSSNTATALFRLERLGISRDDAADNLLGLLAQRLLKSLCGNCRRMKPITAEQRAKLLPFTTSAPDAVPYPEGCPKCDFTGYSGRQGVYELLRFTPEVTRIIKEAASIPEMRTGLKEAGQYLLSDHAIQKLADGLLYFDDVYRIILLEELRLTGKTAEPAAAPAKKAGKGRILIVDDDQDFRNLAELFLSTDGYEVDQATDGVEAIVTLKTNTYDLVLSDIEMPGLDGFTMLQALQSKNMTTPLIFLTANDSMEKEEKGYELGALDYIRKPVRKSSFLKRVSMALEKG